MKGLLTLLFLCLGILCFASTGFAGETVISMTFSEDDLSFRTFEGHDVIELRETTLDGKIGTPGLPVVQSFVAIPGDRAATHVEVLSMNAHELPGIFDIYPQQVPLRISGKEVHAFQKNWAIYGSAALYPEANVELTHQADLAGVCLAGVTIYPFIYHPGEGKLLFVTEIEFVVYYEDGWESPENRGRIDVDSAQRLENQVKSLVLNPQDAVVRSIQPMGDPTKDQDYVIICPSSFSSAWETLRAWKEKKGLNAVIVTTEWINSTHGSGSGGIQDFVQWAVSNWGTEYFLLGGDQNQVAYHTRSLLGDSIPNDTYYADYDNDWVCEVAVGRASVTTAAQVGYLTTKILNYEKNCPATNFAQKGGLYGFDADSSTYGEIQLEYIYDNYIPGSWDVDKVYDSHGGSHEVNTKNSMNEGQNLINHTDHGDYDMIGVGYTNHGTTLNRSEISGRSNGADRPGIITTDACWPGAIDYDCIAERWIEDSNGCGWAALMNSRYGWYNPGIYNTLSPLLQRYFNRSFFSQGHHHIGYTNNDSKNDFNPGGSNTTKKYIFTELTLFGDPEAHIWKYNPVPLSVTHDGSILTGFQTFSVNVKKGGGNILGALVCVMKGTEVYDFGTTNSSGNVSFDINPTTVGNMEVTATYAPDGGPYEGQVFVSSGTPVPPTITNISPSSGHVGGGLFVTVTGTYFTSSADTHVYFGGTEATGLAVITSTQLTCYTPAHTAGAVDVDVSTSYGSDTLTSGFIYVHYDPQISAVNPDNGPLSGGTFVTVSGTYFIAGTDVSFGAYSATGITVVNSSTITCTTPAGDDYGNVNVTVSNAYGSDVLTDGFLYDFPPPQIYSVDPDSGPITGGQLVTVTGDYFTNPGDMSIFFGVFGASSIDVQSTTTLTCLTPLSLGPGWADVQVITSYGYDILSNGYFYFDDPPPEINSIDPTSGPIAGGTNVTIVGNNFTTAAETSVAFGAFYATNLVIIDSKNLTCDTPAGFVTGPVDVQILNPNGSDTLTNGFNYYNPSGPTVTSVSPDYGHVLGHATYNDITVKGTNFTTTGDTTVTFGSEVAPNMTVVDAETITCSVPAHAEGIVAVRVTNSSGYGEIANAFTYHNKPCLYFLAGDPVPGQNVAFEIIAPNLVGEGAYLAANNVLELTYVGGIYDIWIDISLVGYRVLYQTITNNGPKLNAEGRLTFICKYPGLGGPVDRLQCIVGHIYNPVLLEVSNYLDFDLAE